MNDPWVDLRREMHVEKARCRAEHREFDVADALAAVAHALHIPAPRPAPDALIAAVVDDLPHCTGGNCTHAH